MARLDASLTQGLMNPTYASELRNVGATAGMLGGQMRKERRAQEQAQKMAEMDAAGVLAENRAIAKTPEQATAAALAEDQFGALQESRANAAADRKTAERERKQTQAEKLASSKLSGMGKRYDALVRAGETEKAEALFAEMEEIAGGAMVEVAKFVSEAPKSDSSRYLNIGGGKVFDTKTRELIGSDGEPKGKLTEKETRELIQKNKDSYTAESWETYLRNGFDPDFLEPIDSADKDAEASIEVQASARRNLNLLDDLLEMNVGNWESWLTSWAPGSEARGQKGIVDTLEANIAFDRLQKMRDMSKTGGALGAVSQRELDLLSANLSSLDPASPRFKQNVQTIKDAYQRFLDIEQGPQGGSPNFKQVGDNWYYRDPADGTIYDYATGQEVR